MDYFPVLIVGGGRVAFRKTKVIYSYAKKLKIVSRHIEGDFVDFLESNSIPFSTGDYSAEHLDGIRLCIAATNDKELNSRICKDCLSAGILSNNASSNGGEISFSSFFASEGFLASFFTYGKAPVLARKIKEDFREKYSANYLRLIDFISSHRDEYNSRVNTEFRNEFWDKVFAMLMDVCSLEELSERIDTMLDNYDSVNKLPRNKEN